MEQPFRFALAKGAGAVYVQAQAPNAWPARAGRGDPGTTTCSEAAGARPGARRQGPSAHARFYAGAAQTLAQGAWDGVRPGLDTAQAGWGPVAAEGASCTGRHCPAFSSASATTSARGWWAHG